MSSSDFEQDADQMTTAEIEECGKAEYGEFMQKLYALWDVCGVDKQNQVNRANQVRGHVRNLLKDIYAEDSALYEEIKERVKNYEKKISELLVELALPKSEDAVGPVIVREETLRQQLDKLSKLKHNRLKEFQELHSLDLKYCKMLGMPTLSLSSTTGVPSEKDISELQKHVNMLKEEKEHRQKRFYILKKELTTILEETELIPETPLEREILASEDNLSLSNDTFKLLEQIVNNKRYKKIDLENEKATLIDKLSLLWNVLKIDKDERVKFLTKHSSCQISNLNAIKEEISRCEVIKRQDLKKYVEALHAELSALSEKCFTQNSKFLNRLIQDDELNEDILESYDKEMSKLRNQFKNTEHIIRKIKKRQEIWDLMIIFENKANDPNRFKNRGGNLLQEERERKKLQKDLPALEKEIFQDIDLYEEKSGKQFLYYGENFRVFVTKQWEDRNAQKENEKKIRQQLRTQQLEEVQTPTKRPFPTTPKTAPSKLFKSSVGLSVYRTPHLSTARQVPCTTAKMRTNKALQSNSNRRVEKDVLQKKKVNKDVSISPNTTTYTLFSEKLNRPSRYAHRSTVLPSKKIVGTRISVNKNKRKSSNVSTRKSMRLKVNTSNITPARRKLGLPFLI